MLASLVSLEPPLLNIKCSYIPLVIQCDLRKMSALVIFQITVIYLGDNKDFKTKGSYLVV